MVLAPPITTNDLIANIKARTFEPIPSDVSRVINFTFNSTDFQDPY